MNTSIQNNYELANIEMKNYQKIIEDLQYDLYKQYYEDNDNDKFFNKLNELQDNANRVWRNLVK